MELKKINIVSIKKTNYKEKVYDLSVEKNHNFLIGETQTLTHNCDYMTSNAQAALRSVMETYSKHCRFILTCNYFDRIIDALKSRCQSFELAPPSKNQLAKHLIDILSKENVTFEPSDIKLIILASYPDIRSSIQMMQQCTTNGILKYDNTVSGSGDYILLILDVLKDKSKNIKQSFDEIRQIIADAKVKDFTPIFTTLYDEVKSYAPDNIAASIVAIANGQLECVSVPDKEINVMKMFINILTNIKK